MGLKLISEHPVVRIFLSFVSRKRTKILTCKQWSQRDLPQFGNVLWFYLNFRIFLGRGVKHVLNQYSAKFHEVLITGFSEIAFLLRQAVIIFWLTVLACMKYNDLA